MFFIDPELLRNSRQSAYRSAVEHGYRALRFDGALEQQFEAFYTKAHLVRLRMAGFLAIMLYGLFVVIDISTLPLHVWERTVAIRVGLVLPTFVITLVISYIRAWRHHVRLAVYIASLITGLGTVAVVGIGLEQGFPIRYEGMLLVPLFIYLIVCLQWRRALAANLLTLAVFIVVEMLHQHDAQARLYEIVFMIAANAVGAYGGYFLEYSTRTTFLAHALLNELAERDGLTGLFNRRTLNTHLERVWRQANRGKRDLVAIAMIDIDHFKLYNDRYGHVQGDAALKAVADVVEKQARRPLDLAARYGGEEFAAVWYNPAPEELENMGAQITAAVTALAIEHLDNPDGKLSVSVGIALMRPSAGQSGPELLHAADTALYQAKNQGRNRVVLFPFTGADALLPAKRGAGSANGD